MKNEKVSKLYMCIALAFTTCLLLSNVITGKLWAISDSITVPSAVILFPVTYILGDVFTEVYGYKRARTVIWLGFVCNFFAVLIYIIAIALPHPDFWSNQSAYEAVLGTTPRVAIASFAGYLFGEFSNSMVLSKLKVATNGKHLWLRTILSTVVGEGLDSAIFISIAFYGTMSTDSLLGMMLFQYLFKLAYEIVLTPVTYAVIRVIKKKEGIDTFDRGIKYNVLGEKK